MRSSVVCLPDESFEDGDLSFESEGDDETKSMKDFRMTHQYSDSKFLLRQLVCAYPPYFVVGEPGRTHAKLHRKICSALPAEDEETREAIESLAMVRRYALKTEDRQRQSDVWLTLQSRYARLLLLFRWIVDMIDQV